MKLFPASANQQLEFDKVQNLLSAQCRTEFARQKSIGLRIHTRKEFIEPELRQTHEYKLLLQNHLSFPDDAVFNLSKELRLLSIEGSMLAGSHFLAIRKLSIAIQQVFRWFDNDRRIAYPFLSLVIEKTYFEKAIVALIDEVLDEDGNVKDNASEELSRIRLALYRKRNELRRMFDKIVSRMNKLGYLADIEESFINGRRVLAVFAEQKRMIKGIVHGESDSRRTTFIEPEETTTLNNELYSLENDERKEVNRILYRLTANIRVYHSLVETYHNTLGEYDFIRAKAKLAVEYNGNLPGIKDKALLNLVNACHPLLFIYNEKQQKPTIPVSLTLDDKSRILVISGPNAGGKTVTLKTAGLLQMMFQAGLLVSCSPESEFGIFRQLMIHIGDTQSLEFELSTYSSHLLNMKYFMENANGKTLFFIDELGSGSDPNLGGAFAEVIMEELAKKHSLGIVTTHYLNLKVMANKVQGIINGAMAFDEKNLKPLYKLIVGKPGSSYTFSIAERIGLHHSLINKAKQLVDENHFSLDKLLNRTEQDLQNVQAEKKNLDKLLKENERLKKEMEHLMNKEKHQQQVELLKHQNKISEEKFLYLKEMERKLKSLLIEWKKTEDKNKVVGMMQSLLFKQREKQFAAKQKSKLDAKFIETNEPAKVGDKIKMMANRQVGTVIDIRGKKAIVQVGAIPITVSLTDLVVVKDIVPAGE
ncbi:MAG: DNA mismatch repair protein MutS [Bacteroidota bacterium]|nr:DNA mismatch repair protein MutS [Bacteroidota bacterium]